MCVCVCVCVCVCSFSIPSPCIYSREPRVRSCQSSANHHWEPMRRCHVYGLRRWGPWAGRRPGWSAGLPVAPTIPNLLWWVVLGCLVWSTLVLACLEWIWCGSWATLGPIESDIFCDFMSGQSVLATCILAQKHNLHFLRGKVWFRDFIG